MSETKTITVVADYDAMSIAAADRVAAVVREFPSGAITIPTGSTPVGMYAELARRIHAGELDFSRVQIFCLDEYLGVTPEDTAALTKLLFRDFLTPADIDLKNVHFMPSTAANPEEAAQGYEAEIRAAGGLKLAVIGLGPNGHVGFNEPGSDPDTRTRIVDLTRESRDQNAAYYAGATIPEQAMSMGIGTILEAEQVVMIVSGTGKAAIVRDVVEGPMTNDVPGSWISLAGSRAEIIATADAASLLK